MPLWVNKLHSGGEVMGLGMEVRENTAKTNKQTDRVHQVRKCPAENTVSSGPTLHRVWLEALGIMDERGILVGTAPEYPSRQLQVGSSDAGLPALGCKVTAGLRVSKDGNAGTGLNSVWHVVGAH